MPRSSRPRAKTEAEPAIRAAYEQYGVDGFYQEFGATYRNPHERAIRAQIMIARDHYRECFGRDPRGWLPQLAGVPPTRSAMILSA